MGSPTDAFCWCMYAIQALGILSCVLSRIMETGCTAGQYRGMFACSLLTVGAATIFSLCCGNSCWLSSGAIFSLMSVGAVLDPRGSTEMNPF